MGDRPYQPLEGDDGTVRAKALHYASIAEAIARSVTTLKAVGDVEGMKSQAITAIKEKAGSVAEDIEKARTRYAVTAEALIDYSYSLRSAQEAALSAVARINDEEASAETARTVASRAQTQLDASTPEDRGADLATARRAQDSALDAGRQLAAAQQEWHDALDAKNSAADAAISAIVEVVDGKKNNGLEDSWWDDWGSKLYDVFKTICDWAGILSIFLGWVPFLGPLLIALGTIGAILDLVDSIVKAATEGGSVWDVVGAAAGVALSFVGGKAFSKLAKNLKSAAVMKTLPKALADPATMTSMRKILKVKNGESLAPKVMEASKNMHAGLGGTLKGMFKGSLTDLVPKNLVSPAHHSAKDILAGLKEAKLIPDLSPAKLLKLNESLIDTAKLIKLNPAVLNDPTFVLGLAGASAYQVDKSYKAAQELDDPATYLNDKIYR